MSETTTKTKRPEGAGHGNAVDEELEDIEVEQRQKAVAHRVEEFKNEPARVTLPNKLEGLSHSKVNCD